MSFLSSTRPITGLAVSRRLLRLGTPLGYTNMSNPALASGKRCNPFVCATVSAGYRRVSSSYHHDPHHDRHGEPKPKVEEGVPEEEERIPLGETRDDGAAEVTVSGTTTTTSRTIIKATNNRVTVCKETGDWSRAGIGTEEYESVCTGSTGRPYDILAKRDPEGDHRESKGMRLRYGGMREWVEQRAIEDGHPGEEFVVHEDTRTRGSIGPQPRR